MQWFLSLLKFHGSEALWPGWMLHAWCFYIIAKEQRVVGIHLFYSKFALYPGGRSKFISLNCCWNTILRNIPGREKSRPCILGKLIKTMLEWSGPLSTSVISSNDSLLILGYISTQSSCHSYSYFVFPLRKSSVYFTHLLYSNTTN